MINVEKNAVSKKYISSIGNRVEERNKDKDTNLKCIQETSNQMDKEIDTLQKGQIK